MKKQQFARSRKKSDNTNNSSNNVEISNADIVREKWNSKTLEMDFFVRYFSGNTNVNAKNGRFTDIDNHGITLLYNEESKRIDDDDDDDQQKFETQDIQIKFNTPVYDGYELNKALESFLVEARTELDPDFDPKSNQQQIQLPDFKFYLWCFLISFLMLYISRLFT